jgi:mannose-6-phosphate isomerase
MILRLPPNRVWRSYTGGRQLDAMEGRDAPADGPFPEDWIGSTVRAINPGRDDMGEGLARVVFNGQEAVLADLVAADPVYFLGDRHVARFGANPMVLAKYLDSAVRLPFQVHPTVDFSRRHFGVESGKTEAYYILETRANVAEPFIYLGFQRPPRREELRRMIVEQDIPAMERCFDRIPVKPGDVFLVPGGLAHAIGGGVLMVEVMEPTDFVARVEFQVAGRIIPESARFMGRDVDFALDMFSYEPMPSSGVLSRCRCTPRVAEESAGAVREALVDERVTDRFRVSRTRVTAPSPLRAQGFTILLVVEGACTIATGRERISMARFDRIVVPNGLGEMEIVPNGTAVLLECGPPAWCGPPD